MKSKYSFVAKIINGKLAPSIGYDLNVMKNFWEGKEVKVTIEQLYEKANNKQFGLLYGIIYPKIIEHLENQGYEYITVEAIDYSFKELFAYEERVDILTGETKKVVLSKATFDKINMKEYIDNVLSWCSQKLGLNIEIEDFS